MKKLVIGAACLAVAMVALVMVCCLMGCSQTESRGAEPSISVSDSGLIVFTGAGDGGSDLYTLDARSNLVSRVAPTSVYEETADISRDGTFIAYSARDGNSSHIYLLTLNRGTVVQLTKGEFYDRDPRFSADGKSIAFVRAHLRRPYSMGGWTWDDWDIYTVDASGGNLRRLTHEKYYRANCPDFCSGGSTIVYGGDPKGPAEDRVFSVKADGSGGKPADMADGYLPSCSRDGKYITFISDQSVKYDYEVWTCAPDGSGQKQMSHLSSYCMYPVFTQSDSRILFVSDPSRKGRFELRQVDRSGSNPRMLANSHLFSHPMKWHP